MNKHEDSIGSDLVDWKWNGALSRYCTTLGHEVLDVGPVERESVDIDFAFQVARRSARAGDRHLIGHRHRMCIAANKVRRTGGAVHEASRRDEPAPQRCQCAVLVGDLLGEELIDRMVRIWLTTAV